MNMTNTANPDIRHRRSASTKYNSDSNRIFGEQVTEHENTPYRYGQSRPAPFYTEPETYQPPIQSLESRNNPYAARPNEINHTNAIRSNGSLGMIRPGHGEREESRWWDWSHGKTEPYRPAGRSQDERAKPKEGSHQNIFNLPADESGQYTRKNSRYSANPQHIRAVGIVPVTDLKSNDFESGYQKRTEPLVPSEQQYHNRSPPSYPRREQRQEAIVAEQTKPPGMPMSRGQSMSSVKVERAASMWDLFHPHQDSREPMPNNSRKYQRPLPEIKRTEKYDGAWNSAPYASDYQLDHDFRQAPMINPLNVE